MTTVTKDLIIVLAFYAYGLIVGVIGGWLLREMFL